MQTLKGFLAPRGKDYLTLLRTDWPCHNYRIWYSWTLQLVLHALTHFKPAEMAGKIIKLSLSAGNFSMFFRHSLSHSLLLFSWKLILITKTYLTTGPSQIFSSYIFNCPYPAISDYRPTSPSNPLLDPHQSSSPNSIPQKLFCSLCVTNWSLPSAIIKYPNHVSSASLQHSTLQIIAYFSMQRLSIWLGVPGTALLWFKSYLCTQSIKACSHSSQPFPPSCGVPQGPVLQDPLLLPVKIHYKMRKCVLFGDWAEFGRRLCTRTKFSWKEDNSIGIESCIVAAGGPAKTDASALTRLLNENGPWWDPVGRRNSSKSFIRVRCLLSLRLTTSWIRFHHANWARRYGVFV